MEIDLERAVDRFGVPMRRSFAPESDLIDMIHGAGLTLEDASKMRKSGQLPTHISLAWEQYDALNKARFSHDDDT